MEDKLQDFQTTAKLDLDKHGLSYLRGKNVLALINSDIDKYLTALASEDRSVNVPIACTPPNIDWLLSQSKCRKCGKCCIPNPLNPNYPGVEVFEDELKSIAKYLRCSYKFLKKTTAKGKKLYHPDQPNQIATTRWLPLPCPFYDAPTNECRAYEVRSVVCKIYPITTCEGTRYTNIKVNCDYGKDLVKSAIEYLKTKKPSPLLLI